MVTRGSSGAQSRVRTSEAHSVSTRGAVAQRHGQQQTQWWCGCDSAEETKWKNGSGRAKEDERGNEVRTKEEEWKWKWK